MASESDGSSMLIMADLDGGICLLNTNQLSWAISTDADDRGGEKDVGS